MNDELKKKLLEVLKNESDVVIKSNEELTDKIQSMNDICNMFKIIEHYEELDPVLKKHFNDKAKNEKWKDEK